MQKIFKNKKIISLLTNLIFFIATYIIFGYWFNNFDDFIYSQLCVKHYLTVNSFQWVSHANYFLNEIFPTINGWGLFLVLITFFSSYKLYYIFLTKEQTKFSKTILTFAYFITIFWLLYQIQFTIIATFVMVSSVLSLEYFFKNKKKEDLIFGIILFIVGVSIRKESLMFIIPLCVIIFFDNLKNKEFLKKFTATICTLSILMFGATIVDIKTYDPGFHDFYVFNKTRVGISDSRLDHLIIDKDREDFTINKYNMIDSWLFSDYNTFSTEDLHEITITLDEIIKEQRTQMFSEQIIITIMHNVFSHHLWLLLLLLVFFSTDKKKTTLILATIISFIFIFSILNRSTYRVAFSVHIPLTMYLIMHCNKTRFKTKYFLPMLIIPIIMNYLHFSSFDTIGTSKTFSPAFYQELVNNKSNSYYVSNDVYARIIHTIPALDKSVKEIHDNFYLGLWSTNHPYEKEINKINNIDNPIKNLIDKNSHYLIESPDKKISKILQEYYIEEYDIKTTTETIKETEDYVVTKFKVISK